MATVLVALKPANTILWVANGLLLAYLLLAPRWRWRRYFVATFAGQFLGWVLVRQQSWQSGTVLVLLNLSEVAIAAVLIRRRSTELPSFTSRRGLLRFLGYGVMAAPAIVGALFSLIAHLWWGLSLWTALRDWYTVDALGMLAATPAFVAIFRTRFKHNLAPRAALLLPLLLVVLVPLLFQQSKLPAMSIIFPLLIIIELHLGLGWASVGILYVAAVGSLEMSRMPDLPRTTIPLEPLGSSVGMQLVVTSVMFTLYSISVVLENLRDTQKKLKETAFVHRLVTENSRDVIIIADFKGNRRYVSAAAASLGGWTPDEILRRGSMEMVHPDDRARCVKVMAELRSGREEALLECRVLKHDGQYIWVEASLRTIRDPVSGAPIGLLNMVRDVDERKKAQQSRELHQSLLGAIHEVSLDGILVVDEQGKALSYNRRFAEVWRITDADVPRSLLRPVVTVADQFLLSQCIHKIKDPKAFVDRLKELYADPHADDHCHVELNDGRTLERYSTALRSESGRYMGRVWFFRDITERIRAQKELQAAYEEVEKLAVVDPLTGLANRRRFDECLAAEWGRCLREQKPLSMVLVDVDLFKPYNDTYGHLCGDRCLKQIARSAMSVITRSGDLVARFGGEEFAVILPCTDSTGADTLARQLSEAVRARNIGHERSPYGIVTISAGCATMVPQLGQTPADLIDRSDHAMYQAKRAGRNRVCVAAGSEPVKHGHGFLDEAVGI